MKSLSLTAGVHTDPAVDLKQVGGEDASPGGWPWQVDLQRSGSHHCGGSLISKQWVMTAAHCVSGINRNILSVILGRQNLEDEDPTTEVSRGVSKILTHPKFNSVDNDIALLRLCSPVEFTHYIRPVCLAASSSVFNDGTESWVTGWGNVGEGESLPPPYTLQEVEVPVIGSRQCDCLYGDENIRITDNMICSGVLPGGKGSCHGDSGGPMVSKQGSVWVQSGTVSFGVGCARPSVPGVYSRVSRYQPWINSNIRTNKPGFVQFTSSGEDPDSTFICPVRPTPTTPRTTTDINPSTGSTPAVYEQHSDRK